MIEQIEELEQSIIRKSNKYVYFSNGTHMTFGDFHCLKQDIRKKYSSVAFEEIRGSIRHIAILTQQLEGFKEQECYLETAVEMGLTTDKPSYGDLEKNNKVLVDERDEAKKKLTEIGRQVYKDFPNLSILNSFQTNGLKFIIQENEEEKSRFCFDPYTFGGNFHSSISELFKQYDGWYTKNGGWMKIEDDIITLYAKSGDYGVFDNDIATAACKQVFPFKDIRSYAGVEEKDLPKTV